MLNIRIPFGYLFSLNLKTNARLRLEMTQIASNSVPGNKSMSFLIFALVFSSVSYLTLGIPTEFPAAFEGVKAVVQPETSSYWSFSDMISYGVEQIQSAIKYVIGVEDHPREFYVVHIKDEKNPENSKDVLRERGREGIDKDIPLKDGKLPGNSLIVNAENPITEIVNRKHPETDNAPSPETTAPQAMPPANTASEIPITEIKPQNGSNPTTNGKPVPTPETTPSAIPPANAPKIPIIENIPQNGNDESTKPTTQSPETTAPQATPRPPANIAPQIPVAENLPQDGNKVSTTPTTNGEYENIDPDANLPHSESADVKSPLPPFKEAAGVESRPYNGVSEIGAPEENPKIMKSGNVQFNQPEIFDHLQIGAPPTSQNFVPQSSVISSPLGGEAFKSSLHQTEPMISSHLASPAVMLASSPAEEKIGQPAHEKMDPWGQTNGEFQNFGKLLPKVESSPHSNNEFTQLPEPISSPPQYVNSNHNLLGSPESDISKILEPLSNHPSEKVTPQDRELPDQQGGKSDPHPEPKPQETQEPPSSDPSESASVEECETKFADDYCEKNPESCGEFQTDEEFWHHIKQISGCEAKGQENPPHSFDPNEVISMTECETKFEKNLCERDPDLCDQFESEKQFIEYVKLNSKCGQGGQEKNIASPSNDPDHSAEPSGYDPNELIIKNECELKWEKKLCDSDPDFCNDFETEKHFLDYVKQNSGCATDGGENGEHSGTGHDADPFHQEHPSRDFDPLDFDGHDVQEYDNDELSNPQPEPVKVPEKKKTGTKKKSKKEKRSKST